MTQNETVSRSNTNAPKSVSVYVDQQDADIEQATPTAVKKGKQGMRKISRWMWFGLCVIATILYHIDTHPLGDWETRKLDPKHPHEPSYYFKCALAGSLACASHVLLIPLDVVKVNMQYDPQKYQTLRQSFMLIVKEHGWGTRGIWKGANALVVSFGLQGIVKFGMYEFLKDSFMNYFGQSISLGYIGYIWLAAACVAELYADLALCPCEMLKVKIQTSVQGSFPTSFFPALKRFYRERAENGFPFGAIEAVWSRQIPYTMAKFFVFEFIVRFTYQSVLTMPKESYSKQTQLTVTFVSGFLTGLTAALVSHIPDTLFSIKGKPENLTKSYSQLTREYGLWNLATNGLATRMFVVGCLTAIQWYTYDSTKTMLGLPTTATIMKTPAPQ